MGRRETDKIFTIGSKKLEKESKKMSISVQGISKKFKGRRTASVLSIFIVNGYW